MELVLKRRNGIGIEERDGKKQREGQEKGEGMELVLKSETGKSKEKDRKRDRKKIRNKNDGTRIGEKERKRN